MNRIHEKMEVLTALKNLVWILVFLKSVECFNSNYLNTHLNDVDSDSHLEKYVKDVLENFRQGMKEDIPKFNLPVLDPLEYQNVDINVDQKTAKINMSIKEATIQDLSTFQLQEITVNMNEHFLKLKLSIPVVHAAGKCSLNGKLMSIFPLIGNGSFSANITNVEISGIAQPHSDKEYLQFSKLDLDLSWKELQLYFENFLGGKALLSMAEKMLPNIVKNLIENDKMDIMNALNTALKKLPINGYSSKVIFKFKYVT